MPNGMHSHRFMGRTTFNDGHVHGYSGMTSQNPDIPGHMHYITGETTFEDGHIHRYSLQTGPSIPVYGGHIHYYQAATSFNDGHVHYLYGYTSIYNQ
ncbi:MAG TPA: YmaF family protein [Acetivibrio clariflavus]|nr:YmaF family protein [Acetivibrio clariflavus]HPU41786.1 YmaF family protein [Acetivibrio clariflavus]